MNFTQPAKIAAASLLAWRLLVACSIGLADENSFFEMSLEELAAVNITSVSRKPEEAAKAASAVFVVTAEDIRRSGATSIPEALRLVPGLEVARIGAKAWAISARGFANYFAMKLLVLIDGRTVYKTLFSGVEWDEQDIFLEDVDRIEVIRGPGASVWGANAVNGVINIITKSSKDTHGGHTFATAGNEEQMTGLRYGEMLSEATSYRVFGSVQRRSAAELAEGGDAYDESWNSLAGFRVDSDISDKDLLTVQSDGFYGRQQQRYTANPVAERFAPDIHSLTAPLSGANILSRWTRTLAEESDIQFQTYYAYLSRDNKVINEQIDTLDFDFQHRFPLLERHDIVWGLGYRNNRELTNGTFIVSFEPPNRTLDLFTGFVQDEISIIPDRLRLILGTKVEHNDFTGYEVQPTVRAAWTPDDKQTIWGAVSRAVRTPSRLEANARVFYGGAADTPFGRPVAVIGGGNEDAEAEKLLAYELGYRAQISETLSFDAAGFYNEYRDHLSLELGQPYPSEEPFPHIHAPLTAGNKLRFRSIGAEAVLTWQAAESWRLVGSYSHINIDNDQASTTNIDFLRIIAREAPEHQLSLRSLLSVTENVDVDAMLRYAGRIAVGRYDDVTASEPFTIPEYIELNVRLAYRPRKDLELSLVGRDVLHSDHAEWQEGVLGGPLTLAERGVYGKLTYRF